MHHQPKLRAHLSSHGQRNIRNAVAQSAPSEGSVRRKAAPASWALGTLGNLGGPGPGRCSPGILNAGSAPFWSAQVPKAWQEFDAEIRVSREGQTVPGTSIMGLMMLAAAPGCCIRIETDGPDAQAALETLAALVADGFGERD